ncbi:MAG: glycine cleavage system aminomethyltransferase GcvT [Saprospiraceae bacterium]|nr:glycine cleavage system aminomethyltransferase GcvT [Saprospiraceae bacterium]
MKNTPLTDRHIALGAKMAEFAGYNMPISYKGIKEEHECVRANAGMFDVSHMGEFIVKGKQAMELIQYVTSNDVSKLKIGDAQYSCLPNREGGIIDDLLVYRLPENLCAEGERAYMLVVNASNIEKDWNWITENNTFDTRLINISDETGLVAIQGPKVIDIIQSLTPVNLSKIKYYNFVKDEFAGYKDVIISATGYTGAGGFEIYAHNDQISKIWDEVMRVGQEKGLQAIGLGARDTLRLEMGFCLYGNDIDDTTSPLEAGLAWITKIHKTEFIGKNWLNQQKENGIKRKLVAFTLEDRRVPRHHYPICNQNNEPIGLVTSGTFSPSLNKSIGLGYVPVEFAEPNTNIFISMGSKNLPATVCKLPFIQQ